MRRSIATLLLFSVCGSLRAQTPAEVEAADEKLLLVNKVASDGPGLLRYLRDRTIPKEIQDKMAERVQQLGDVSYQQRVKAASDLVKAGEIARPCLLDALQSPDVSQEVRRRAQLCLRQISDNPESPQTAAVLRLLSKQKPMGAAATLIDFLPFVSDPEVLDVAQHTLNTLAMVDGKPDPAVVAALKNARANIRAMAGEALVRSGGLANKAIVNEVLHDKQPSVRLPVAMALVEKQDRAAVPELIKTLDSLPADQVWSAEELLHRIAGDKAPQVWIGAEQTAEKTRVAWQAWWTKNESSVDLSQLDEAPRLQGLTLISQLGKGTAGVVFEVNQAKEVRWKIEGLQYPVDAQIIGNNRVLIAEYLGRKITERDFEGKILWERSIELPIACRRLPGNKTFIATRRQILILDAQGKPAMTYNHQSTSIAAAAIGPDGHVYVISSGGQFQKLNAQGREVKSFQVGPIYTLGANLDILPAGRILVPQYRDNKVVEYDAAGKVVWEARVQLPTSVVRLPSGNTLVTSTNQSRVIELDRQGQVVWEYTTDSRPLRARRR